MMPTKRLALKHTYYLSFIALIVLPILVVFGISMPLIYSLVRNQATENINLVQSNLISTLTNEFEEMSMRLSHLVYTNNSEVLSYVAGTDTDESSLRYQYEQKLIDAIRLALPPVSDIVAINFYMKSGRVTRYKNSVEVERQVLGSSILYEKEPYKSNHVLVGSSNEGRAIYAGSASNSLMLVASFMPDLLTDRSERIDMVALFELSECTKIIQKYDNAYLTGENNVGLSAILKRGDYGDSVLFSDKVSEELLDSYLSGTLRKDHTYIVTPFRIGSSELAVLSIVKTNRLTGSFLLIAISLVLVILVILTLFAIFSQMFLHAIINPITGVWKGLRQVEEGNLDTHLDAQGSVEIRTMIHSFNAMVRRLKALIAEYEEKVKKKQKPPESHLKDLIDGHTTTADMEKMENDFFSSTYLLIGLVLTGEQGMPDREKVHSLVRSFDRNPLFASHCTLASLSPSFSIVYYRVEGAYRFERIQEMIKDLSAMSEEEFSLSLFALVSPPSNTSEEFAHILAHLMKVKDIYRLMGDDRLIDLQNEDFLPICEKSAQYVEMANALYIADERVVTREREAFSTILKSIELENAKREVLSFVLACGTRYGQDFSSLSDIFAYNVDYYHKIMNMEDHRSLELWLNSFISAIFSHALQNLNLDNASVITKAKRYIIDNHIRSDLSLSDVATYVGLNEKYFTTKFSQASGETYQSYLTALRLQKAQELIGSTTFKMYEIAQMVGYASVEHFNRVFKKELGMTPGQWKKKDISDDSSTK